VRTPRTTLALAGLLAWLPVLGATLAAQEALPDGGSSSPAPDAAGRSAEVRATALMLLAFISDGSTPTRGPHRVPVRRGFQWFAAAQQPNGAIGTATSLHDHALATWAFASGVAAGCEVLAPRAARAIEHLELHGQPGAPGFDLELAAWRCLVRRALLSVDPRPEPLAMFDEARFQVLRLWLDTRETPALAATSALDIAAELTVRTELDREGAAADPRVAALRAALLALDPSFDDPERALDPRATLLATWSLYVLGGPEWDRWRRGLDGFARAPRDAAPGAPIFDLPPPAWRRESDRVSAGALAEITLTIYYRYSRLLHP